VIVGLTVVMVGAALYVWRRTGRAWTAVVVVLLCVLVAFATGLIP
jgi:hypothetical protein